MDRPVNRLVLNVVVDIESVGKFALFVNVVVMGVNKYD
jgi:hypothetical protein